MAGKADKTAGCRVCGKTGAEREAMGDGINYHKTFKFGAEIHWYSLCIVCYKAGRSLPDVN